MTRVTISVSDELAARLQREARRRGASVSELVRRAVEAEIAGGRPEGDLPFAAVGRSGARHTARDAETILASEWGGRARRR
jgi:metal-responsive CopG/Arc/MetJ family transcriptional regulator